MNDEQQIYYYPFVVNETPYCEWESDLPRRDLDFINSIDPNYFDYLVQAFTPGLANDATKQSAALALRTAYAHGLESLFAVSCAAIQAPDCVIGWLHRYTSGELREVVRKVTEREPVMNRWGSKRLTWTEVNSRILAAMVLSDKPKEQHLKESFASTLERLARDFLDETQIDEYNSIKHGMRARAGGFHLRIGLETTPGMPAPEANMHSLGGSEFGSTYYVREQLGGPNFRLRRHSINWHPEQLAQRLTLISMILNNLLIALKIGHGVSAETLQFVWPSETDLFSVAWDPKTVPFHFTLEGSWKIADSHLLTKDQIVASYKPRHDP